jgi:hypothetical protein
MSCDHYWKKGILLLERGEHDPHLASCLDCAREHRAREDMIRALPLVGTGGGDPMWQERVWSRIAMQRAEDARSRITWQWGGGLVVAAAALALWTQVKPRQSESSIVASDRPRYKLTTAVVVRSAEEPADPAEIGKLLEVWGTAREEVRVYLGERLLLRCASGLSAPHSSCVTDEAGVAAKLLLTSPGEYRIITFAVKPGDGATFAAQLPGKMSLDLNAILESKKSYKLDELPVR